MSFKETLKEQKAIIANIPILPTSISADGHNKYLVPCASFGAARHYAACQGIIKDQESGEGRKSESVCNADIAGGRCASVDLMKREKKAGHALFYIPRTEEERLKKPVKVTDEGYQKGWTNAAFEKVKAYLNSRPGKDKPPIVSCTEPFDEVKSHERKPAAFIPAVIQDKKSVASKGKVSEEFTLDHAGLVNKLMKEESNDK